MNDEADNEAPNLLDGEASFQQTRCDYCRGRGTVASPDGDPDHNLTRCPVCRGKGRVIRERTGRGLRTSRGRRLSPGHHRPGGGGRPSARRPLLPLSVSFPREPALVPRRGSDKPPSPMFEEHLACPDLDDEQDGLGRNGTRQNYLDGRTELLASLVEATGLSSEKATQLRLADVLWGASTLYVRQRGGPAESIPIPHALREELYNFLQDRTAAGVSQDPDSYLFWRPQAADDWGQPRTPEDRRGKPDFEDYAMAAALSHRGISALDLLRDKALYDTVVAEVFGPEAMPYAPGGSMSASAASSTASASTPPVGLPETGFPGPPTVAGVPAADVRQPPSPGHPASSDLDVLGRAGLAEPGPHEGIGPEL